MNKIKKSFHPIKSQQTSTDGLPSGKLATRNVGKGKEEATVSRVVFQGLPKEVINYMMRNLSNTPTFDALRKTCKYFYFDVLSDKSLKDINNFMKTHQLNYGSQITLKFLHLLAHKKEYTPTTDELTKAINPLPLSLKDATEQLPVLEKRYKKLQTIFDDLRQRLAVFTPSLQAFAYVAIKAFVQASILTLLTLLSWAFLEIFTPFSHCKFLELYTLKLQPCTYWQATEKFLKYLSLLYHHIPNLCGEMAITVLKYSFIFAVPIICYFMLPGQVAQFRAAATTILDSVAEELGY